ncbi:hypothetical protein HK097_000992 [Rhizophlyctis rosea]|uniref:Acetyl-CoA hydrolase n=1 Tax=Rhizophlyctis rosea TaxID=64517 RepID=A0AAD5S632_9FUNG|nr:hypothetical protein HK097_000992 [Rhizophlyctis rosea]
MLEAADRPPDPASWGTQLYFCTYQTDLVQPMVVGNYSRLSTSVVEGSAHVADPRLFGGADEDRRSVDVLLVGNTFRHYMLRHRYLQMKEKGTFPELTVRKHPGWKGQFNANFSNEHKLSLLHGQFESYASSLKTAKICLFDSSIWKYALAKYIEAAHAGCLIIADVPYDRADFWRQFIVPVSYSHTNEQLLTIIRAWLANDTARLERTKIGQRLASDLTYDHLVGQFLRGVGKVRRKEWGVYYPHGFQIGCMVQWGAMGDMNRMNDWCMGRKAEEAFVRQEMFLPDEAVHAIKDNDLVFVHGIAAVPTKFLDAIATQHERFKKLEFCHLHLEAGNPCDDAKYGDKFFTHHFFIGAVSRKGVAEGRGAYVPCFLSDVPQLMRRGDLKPDVALLNVSPPDKHGYCSLGTEVCAAFPAAQTAKTIIAQINPSMPRTFGSSAIHISCIDYVIHLDQKLPGKHASKSSYVEEQIGKNIAALVPDGGCLQMGIGAIPNAVLRELKDHRDLGIHTEMFEEGAIDLIESGAITNFNKTFLPGKLVTSFITGITNNPGIIGQNPKVVAINSAVEIDLTGQVCAGEFIFL